MLGLSITYSALPRGSGTWRQHKPCWVLLGLQLVASILEEGVAEGHGVRKPSESSHMLTLELEHAGQV